ncbi:MAG: hypothetical protein JWN90_27 [Parcubacteria group bacterium]|nr:hypothetical protein [Parcubacteria group bacterium]
MTYIRVNEYPLRGEIFDPEFVRDAYVGLKLEVEKEIPLMDDTYPSGAYLVPLTEVIRQMAEHNVRASQFIQAHWHAIVTFLEEFPGEEREVLLAFSRDSCATVQ